jgi:hypothetical protein
MTEQVGPTNKFREYFNNLINYVINNYPSVFVGKVNIQCLRSFTTMYYSRTVTSEGKYTVVTRQVSKQSRVIRFLLAVLMLVGAALITVVTSSPASAVAPYDNAAIADKALSYWNGSNITRAPGSAACKDAQKPGDSGGQCRAFVNCVVWMVSGHTQNLGGTDYFQSFLNAGGMRITNTDSLAKGDIVQIGQGTHTFIIVSKVSAGQYMVVDSNHWNDETVGYYKRAVSLDDNTRAYRMGTISSENLDSQGSLQLVLDSAGAIWAKNTIGDGGWIPESPNGEVKISSASDGLQMILDSTGQVWAKNAIGNGGWTAEAGGITAISAGKGGLQMILDTNGTVWAKTSIGNGGWVSEAGGISAISAGANGLQMILDANGSIWAKSSVGNGGWIAEANGIIGISAGGSGLQMILDANHNVWAKSSIGAGGWTAEAGGIIAISAASDGLQMTLDSNHNVWAKNTISSGGWTAEGNGIRSISAGANGLQVILDTNGTVWAKNAIGNGGWTAETPSNESAIAAGK